MEGGSDGRAVGATDGELVSGLVDGDMEGEYVG